MLLSSSLYIAFITKQYFTGLVLIIQMYRQIYQSIKKTLNGFKDYTQSLSMQVQRRKENKYNQLPEHVFEQLNKYFQKHQQYFMYPDLGQVQTSRYLILHLLAAVHDFTFSDYEIVQEYESTDIQDIPVLQQYFYSNIFRNNHTYDIIAQQIIADQRGPWFLSLQLSTMKSKLSVQQKIRNLYIDNYNRGTGIYWTQQPFVRLIDDDIWKQQIKIQQIQRQINNTFVLYFQTQSQFYWNYVMIENLTRSLSTQLIRIQIYCRASAFKFEDKQYKKQMIKTIILHQIYWCRVAIQMLLKIAYKQGQMISDEYQQYRLKANIQQVGSSDLMKMIQFQIKSSGVIIQQYFAQQLGHIIHFMHLRPQGDINQFSNELVEIQKLISTEILQNDKLVRGNVNESVFQQYQLGMKDPTKLQLQQNQYVSSQNKKKQQISKITRYAQFFMKNVGQEQKRGLSDHINAVKKKFVGLNHRTFITQSKNMMTLLSGYMNMKRMNYQDLQIDFTKRRKQHYELQSALYHLLHYTMIPNSLNLEDGQDQIYTQIFMKLKNLSLRPKIAQQQFLGPVCLGTMSKMPIYIYNFGTIFDYKPSQIYSLSFYDSQPRFILQAIQKQFKQTQIYSKNFYDRFKLKYSGMQKQSYPVKTQYLQIQTQQPYQVLQKIIFQNKGIQQRLLKWINQNHSQVMEKLVQLQKGNFPPVYRAAYVTKQIVLYIIQQIKLTSQQQNALKLFAENVLVKQMTYNQKSIQAKLRESFFKAFGARRYKIDRSKKKNKKQLQQMLQQKQKLQKRGHQLNVLQSKFKLLRHMTNLSVQQVRKSFKNQAEILKKIQNRSQRAQFLKKIFQMKKGNGQGQQMMFSIVNQINENQIQKLKQLQKLNKKSVQQLKSELVIKQNRIKQFFKVIAERQEQLNHMSQQFSKTKLLHAKTLQQMKNDYQKSQRQKQGYIDQQIQEQGFTQNQIQKVLKYVNERFRNFQLPQAHEKMMLFGKDFQKNLFRYLKYKTKFNQAQRNDILITATEQFENVKRDRDYIPFKKQEQLTVNTQLMRQFIQHIMFVLKKTKVYRTFIQLRIAQRRVIDQMHVLQLEYKQIQTVSTQQDQQKNQLQYIGKKQILEEQQKRLQMLQDSFYNIIQKYTGEIKRKYSRISYQIPQTMQYDQFRSNLFKHISQKFKDRDYDSEVSNVPYDTIQLSFEQELKRWKFTVEVQIKLPTSNMQRLQLQMSKVPNHIKQQLKNDPSSRGLAKIILEQHRNISQTKQKQQSMQIQKQSQQTFITCIIRKLSNFIFLGMRYFFNIQKMQQMLQIRNLGALKPLLGQVFKFAQQPYRHISAQFRHLFDCVKSETPKFIIKQYQQFWNSFKIQDDKFPQSVRKRFRQLQSDYKRRLSQIQNFD